MAFFGFKDIDKLSEVDMAIYRYIVDHDEQVPLMRVRDMAKGAHVSNSSVMRFIHKIGYNSFPEFKVSFKNENQDLMRSQQNILNIFTRDAFPHDIEKTIKLVAHLMLDADNIVFFGMGGSGAIAEYGARQAASLGFNSFAVKDPFYPLIAQLQNTSNNVIITLSVSGKTSEIVETLNNFVNSPDTILISVTGNIESPVARIGRYALTYNVPETRIHKYYDLTSQVPCVYIVDGLLMELHNQDIERQK
ncbi:MurR/RpiR family transcriptional regulator [Companilactobacillus alimentarius]|uniref:RpiR family transcriptional regulator n=1 Tax=Companilactobacillus alimentarius DSM 20249 TaxID=1423720 RepID=A0A2K9HIN7_9LACO|nr:MurR/RpiR family transcriptional regulator [Companilactobacillus alimentarius]AUI72400.1 RpiR family transcriptional regulator [Companilactobacillus alimentarius DSM 20249]KRK75860.1 transcription regulator [Companilactobacillus alimentarius DSM 20249]GEO45819.1 RpiR family transcriptional regulator [Companilactobacillus alimentarius]